MIHSILGKGFGIPAVIENSFEYSPLVSFLKDCIYPEKHREILRSTIPKYVCQDKKPSFLSNLITKIFRWIFSPIRFVYQLFCKQASPSTDWSWIDTLPQPKKQGEFSWRKPFIVQARTDLMAFLSKAGSIFPRNALGGGKLPLWDPIDLFLLSDEKIYKWGLFPLSGKELKFMAKSLVVSYDPRIVRSHQLKEILRQGSQSNAEDQRARGRMVSSLTVSIRSSLGTPILRCIGEPLAYYRVYTSQFPDLKNNQRDQREFISEGVLRKEEFKNEIKRILNHFFIEARSNGDDALVLPGFCLESHIPDTLQPAASDCFALALKECIQSKEGDHFKEIIYSDPNAYLFRFVNEKLRSLDPSRIKVAQKNCLDVAHNGAKQQLRVAVFYTTGPGGIPGQFKPIGKVALGQMFGLFTTLLASQHPGCNPLLKNRENYTRSLS